MEPATRPLVELLAKYSERKTIHEWLTDAGIPQEENGKPICLLRRLRIAMDELKEYKRKASFHKGGFGLPKDYYDNPAYLRD